MLSPKILIPALALVTPLYVNATPTIYPTQPDILKSVITNDQVTSKFVMDNHDNSSFYVLPPKKGYSYLTDVTMANANLGFCRDMSNLQQASHVISDRLKQIDSELSAYQPTLDEAGRKYAEARGALDGFTQSNHWASDLDLVSQQINSNQTRLNHLYTLQTHCSSDCESIASEIEVIITKNSNLEDKKANIIDSNENGYAQEMKLKRRESAKKIIFDQAQNRMADVVNRKKDLLATFLEIYSNYAKLEGGTANLEYQTDWSGQVNLLNSLNPTKKFNKMSTHDVKIHASLLGTSREDIQSLPALLDGVVNGIKISDHAVSLSSFPEQVTANVRLALTGACPIVDPVLFDIKNIEGGKIKLGVSTEFQYDSSFNNKFACDYDEKAMYSKVIQAGNSGFLFWKSSWQRIDIDQVDAAAFSCTWDGQAATAMDFQKRREIESEALTYAISKMVFKYGTPMDPGVQAPPIPNSGLGTLAISFDHLAFASPSFAVVGWVMRGFDAIFGGGSSTGDFHSSSESTVRLKFDENLTSAVDDVTNFNVDK